MLRMSCNNKLIASINQYVIHLSSGAPLITDPLQLAGTDVPTGPEGQPTGGTASAGASRPSSGGVKLSAGAAAGIGVGGALLLVAIFGLIFFLFRRRGRKRREEKNQLRPDSPQSNHQPPLIPYSPPPQFSSPYEQPHEGKYGPGDPPPMTLAPQYGQSPIRPHELESSGTHNSPNLSAYRSQSESMTPKRSPSPGIVAPLPRSPPVPMSSSGFQYTHQSNPQVSPPVGGQRTPGSNHESGSYGFPSHETSPNPEAGSFQFQQPYHQNAGSPESQQHLFPRRAVGAATPRSSR